MRPIFTSPITPPTRVTVGKSTHQQLASQVLYCGMYEGKLHVYDVKSKLPLAFHQKMCKGKDILTLAVTDDGSRMAIGGTPALSACARLTVLMPFPWPFRPCRKVTYRPHMLARLALVCLRDQRQWRQT